jgi:hypothetical protein
MWEHARHRRLWTALAAICAFTLSLNVSSAGAFHIPGADYSGAVGGGGTISFVVSSDGSSVTNLSLTGIQGVNCSLPSKQYTQPIPIAGNNFDNGEVSGGFPNVQGAHGHLRVGVPGLLSSCTIETTWSAITRVSPRGSAECQVAQANVKQAKKALHKAKKTGNRAKINKRYAEWATARGTRDQYCG